MKLETGAAAEGAWANEIASAIRRVMCKMIRFD